MQTPSTSHPAVQEQYLPEEFILGLKATLDEKRRLYEALPKEIADLEKRFEAAMVFSPPGFDPTKARTKTIAAPLLQQAAASTGADPKVSDIPVKRTSVLRKPRVQKMGWRKGLMYILDHAEGGVAHQPLLKQAREDFSLPPSNGEKAFYNALAKLTQSGAVVKHGNLLYSAKAMAEAKAKGTLPPVADIGRRAGSSADLIHGVLLQNPAGLSGPALRKLVSELPDAPKSLRDHGQYVYNILGTMMGAGDVVKEDGIYRLRSPVGDES
ncbi:hypothetical protein [Acidovorax sp.]|uniref:hypothetical protein n=1 Tax=Acidovorax sp. TaxID=1872122 RepID=UPI0025C71010|nr:hypothetical protein [Acidovorax sp.]